MWILPIRTARACVQRLLNAFDFTKSRVNTFYDTPERGVAHVDFTNPYCPRLRAKVIKCLERTDIPFHKTGCYVCTEGPRFETAAEIKMFAMLGGDLVGMTNIPESVLAREAEMCYTNYWHAKRKCAIQTAAL